MNLKFSSKSVKLAGPLKAFVETRLESIEKISGDIIDSELILNKEKIDFTAELIIKTKSRSYQIESSDPILKQALRTGLNTLKTQAKKNKEKLKKEKTRTTKKVMSKARIKEMAQPPDDTEEPNRDDAIIVSENCSRKPLSVEEAIFFLKESGENAYMFLNADVNKMSVVFYDKSKKISIIESNIK